MTDAEPSQSSPVTLEQYVTLSGETIQRWSSSFQAGHSKDVLTVVIGNESADLDSCVSSVIYAYLASHLAGSCDFAPVLNLAREDIKLRKEFVLLTNKIGLQPDQLLCRDDFPTGKYND